MTTRLTRKELVALLDDGEAFLRALEEAEIVGAGPFSEEEVEDVLVAHTLYRELEVNLPGVEVILRLRRELIRTRAQVRDLLRLLSESRSGGASRLESK